MSVPINMHLPASRFTAMLDQFGLRRLDLVIDRRQVRGIDADADAVEITADLLRH